MQQNFLSAGTYCVSQQRTYSIPAPAIVIGQTLHNPWRSIELNDCNIFLWIGMLL